MSRLVPVAGLALLGCAADPSPASLAITVDTTAAPDFVLLEAYYGSGTPSSMAIATPEILAGTAPRGATAMTWSGRLLAQAGHDGFTGFGLRSSTSFDHPLYIGVVAVDMNGIVAGGWSGPVDRPDNASLEVALDARLMPELWGTTRETGSCFRLDTGTTTVFLTRADDPDCDGLTGAQDTQPYAFCDPAATSGPARDACL